LLFLSWIFIVTASCTPQLLLLLLLLAAGMAVRLLMWLLLRWPSWQMP
jgi:hypothetical protein